MQIHNIILPISIIIQGVLLLKFLYKIIKQPTLSDILISIISIMMLLHLTNIYTYQFINLSIPFHVLPVVIISYGPLIYAYVTALSCGFSQLPRNVYYSFIPVFAVIIVHIVGHDDYYSWEHILYHAFIYIYSLGYIIASVYLVYLDLSRGKHELSWTYHFLILLIFLIVFIALDYARFITSADHFKNFTSASIIWVGFIISFIWLLRSLLYPSTQSLLKKKNIRATKFYSDSEGLKMYEKLKNHMLEDRPYLSHDLTIRKLAEQLDIPYHVLSLLINQHFGKNFQEFVNSYRVENAKQLLGQSDLKILAVALESGFSNKTSFNRTFKKITGIPPSEYRNNPVE